MTSLNKIYSFLFIGLIYLSCGIPPNWICGKWEVVDSTHEPFEHISYCERLFKGAIFEFQKDQTLFVYENSSTEPCINGGQSFKVKKSEIQFLEYDMIFNYQFERLSKNEISLKITGIPSYFYDLDWNNPEVEKQAMNIDKEGITITLRKIQ